MKIMDIVSIIKKQGIGRLFKYYFHYNQLGIIILFSPFLFKSKVGQEQLREIISNRIQKKFQKKFVNSEFVLRENMEGDTNDNLIGEGVIWTAWFQGIENAPELVRINHLNLIKHNDEKKIIVITSENIKNYVQLPHKIYEKWKHGIIPDTQFSDILRVELLATYGGIWLDATVFVTEKLPFYFEEELFLYQALKPGRNGLAVPISSWAIASKHNNMVIIKVRDLMLEYWLTQDKNMEYFVFHRLLLIAMEHEKNIASKIIPVDNSQPHALLIASKKRILSRSEIKKILELSSVHKLSYKVENDIQQENYENILKLLSNP